MCFGLNFAQLNKIALNKESDTDSMIRIVQPETAHKFHLVSCEGRKQVLNGEYRLGDLSGRVECRADDLVRFDRLVVMVC